MTFMHNDLMPEEAIEITEENIETIVDEYDVDHAILRSAMGMMFVGEIGCEYWYGIFPAETFRRRYRTTQEIGRIGFIVEKTDSTTAV